MQVSIDNEQYVWKEGAVLWIALVFIALVLGFVYYDGLRQMVTWWNDKPEYGHGFMIPMITVFFIWQKKDQLEKLNLQVRGWVCLFYF